MRKKSWLLRVAHFLLKVEATRLAWKLSGHVANCPSRRCQHVDLDNCDETSFCAVGNDLFVRGFDLWEYANAKAD